MSITFLQVENFKSFQELAVNLRPFTVVVGGNGAGKSNFISIFRFVRDIRNEGLVNAISRQGGVRYLRNVAIGPTRPLRLSISSDQVEHFLRPGGGRSRFFGVAASDTNYTFSLEFASRGARYTIADERLTQSWDVFHVEETARGNLRWTEQVGSVTYSLTRHDGHVYPTIELNEGSDELLNDLRLSAFPERISRSRLLLEDLPYPGSRAWATTLGSIAVYDIDPKLPKKAVPVAGKAELEEDGSNLAIVISKVIATSAGRRQLSNLLQDLLPFVDRLGVQQAADTTLLFRTRETYWGDVYFPASLMSDGSLHLTALVVALFFEDKSFEIIEEPERNIHPALMARVVSLMQQAADNKQVLATTHNPELLKHAGLENLLLVRRNRSGFSVVERPIDADRVRVFLEQEIGIADIFVQNFFAG